MNVLRGMVVAFSMYSKIPMPQIEWNKINMKYALCYFPLVGLVIGFALQLWVAIANWGEVGKLLTAVICTLLPLAITGGIHLDGFCDTIDGLSSHQSKEKKLEILADPNAGAFAVMGCIGYLLLYFALWHELDLGTKEVTMMALSYVMIRAWSGYGLVTLPCAKKSGLAKMFSDAAHRTTVKWVMVAYILMTGLCLAYMDILYGIPILVILVLAFLYYRHISQKEFGGITGDLAGFFLQIAEIAVLATLVVAQKFI